VPHDRLERLPHRVRHERQGRDRGRARLARRIGGQPAQVAERKRPLPTEPLAEVVRRVAPGERRRDAVQLAVEGLEHLRLEIEGAVELDVCAPAPEGDAVAKEARRSGLRVW